MRRLPALLLACALALPVPAADTPAEFADAALAARYHALLKELRCLVCQNQSLEDSHADLAQDLRDEVREMVAAGRTDGEIKDFMVSRYGDFVLYRPPVRGATWLLWFGPFVLLATGAAVAVLYSRRRRGAAGAPLSATEEARVRALLDHDREGPA